MLKAKKLTVSAFQPRVGLVFQQPESVKKTESTQTENSSSRIRSGKLKLTNLFTFSLICNMKAAD